MGQLIMDLTMETEILAPLNDQQKKILTPAALEFAANLHQTFNSNRLDLLKQREIRQSEIDDGHMPDFLTETEHIRQSDWEISPVPNDLLDRRVEITGPVDRKMIINALNSGVKVFMADFEDSNSPTFENIINGQINLRDAINKTISFTNSKGKFYSLNDETATLMVRPRGWHLLEKHVLVNGEAISGSIFDFAIYFFHNAKNLLSSGAGPYFYLPKLESHLEARLWNDIFNTAQDQMGIARGSIKATVLIETILAAFEMDEILYELREHSAGLNCGRWDYIFSFIKKFRNCPEFVLPNRNELTMDRHFLRSYVDLLVHTCHKRGAHAMGGMAAQIPIKNDPIKNETALAKVQDDKEREAKSGHDGTWIAHPGLAPIAMDAFNLVMSGLNQIHNKREDVQISSEDLLKIPKGIITEEGLRSNIKIGIQYLEAWLSGNGCVPLYHLMEDAATAEISRAQLWQWLHHEAKLEDDRVLSPNMFNDCLVDELKSIESEIGTEQFIAGKFDEASNLFSKMITNKVFDEFLTIPAYKLL